MTTLNKKFQLNDSGKKQAIIGKAGKQTIWFVLFKDSKVNQQKIGDKTLFEILRDHAEDLSVEEYDPKKRSKEYPYSYRLTANGNPTGLTANSKTAIKGEIKFSFTGEKSNKLRSDLIPKHLAFLQNKISSEKKEEKQEKKLIALMAAS